jgi:hypothetical protein
VCFSEQRPILLISTQLGVHAEYRQEMDDMAERYNTFLRLDRCNHEGRRVNVSQRCAGDRMYDYPHVLQVRTGRGEGKGWERCNFLNLLYT